MFDNQIENPNQVVKYIVPLPNLKALWLNNNPVVDACSNFHSITELMPNLEICNSVLTQYAGAWAMLYYARDQGAKSLEEIRSLSLAGKGVMYMKNVDVFSEMTGLRRLDLSDHPEFLMCPEMKEAKEYEAMFGLGKEERAKVTFAEHSITVMDILQKLDHLEELICDEDLEQYILEERPKTGILSKLRLLNAIPLEVGIEERKKQHEVVDLLN